MSELQGTMMSFSLPSYHHRRYERILREGTFYYPAWRHYGKRVSVVCDRCHKRDINACIGLGDMDLCGMCMDEISRDKDYLPFLEYPEHPPCVHRGGCCGEPRVYY